MSRLRFFPGISRIIADMLVPELTRRSRYKDAYRKGTLREKLFGNGRARLTAPHPAVQYRPRMKGPACAFKDRLTIRFGLANA